MSKEIVRKIRNFLLVSAALLTLHGLLMLIVWSFGGSLAVEDSVVGKVLFVILVIPAALLLAPFTSLLWKLHLYDAPGWFAWPKPAAFFLVYMIWVGTLLGVNFLLRIIERGAKDSVDSTQAHSK